MANAAITSLFSPDNKRNLDKAKSEAKLQLKAPPGEYFGRLAKVGMKLTPQNNSRFFLSAVLLCDAQGNESCRGEQSINTIDVVDDPTDKPNPRTKAGQFQRMIEAMDSIGYTFPTPKDDSDEEARRCSETFDADCAEASREKPYLRINISPGKGGRKYLNINEVVSIEMIEETIKKKLGGSDMKEVDDKELDKAIDADSPDEGGGEPAPLAGGAASRR